MAAIDAFVAAPALPLITFAKGQRKDAVMAQHLARFTGDEGLLFVGKAQEKAAVCRTEKRRNPQTGQEHSRVEDWRGPRRLALAVSAVSSFVPV